VNEPWEWATAAELAAMKLPDLPRSESGFIRKIKAAGWEGRPRNASGGGRNLPDAAQNRFVVIRQGKLLAAAAPAPDPRAQMKRDGIAAWFDRQPDHRKAKAIRAATILLAVRRAEEHGVPKLEAIAQASREHGVSRSTIFGWQKIVAGAPECDWRYWLAPRHFGAKPEEEIPPQAWNMLRADYLRLEQPSFTDCARRLRAAAGKQGWKLPSDRTLRRRLEALPAELLVLARKGEKALRRLFPAQERDRTIFHALEAVNADGHTFDVFVRWEDGSIGRPVFVAFQDLYSGKMVSWRVDRTENKHAVRLAFGDMVNAYGIPRLCWFDNGRHFASKWLTGQAPNRYRFKIKDEEPAGILTSMGVEVRWTQPYSGQSKPIERAFRDFAGGFAKHPALAGAYTGNKPDAKPENYGSRAVPIADFLALLAEAVAEHNARLGRQSSVCDGRSFDQAFQESYETALIQKASEADRRLWMLAAEGVKVRGDASLHLEGNRYWADFLLEARGHQVIARFDPDDLHDGLHVYRLDGVHLGHAPCVEAVGFDSVEKGREHAQARNAWLRAKQLQLAAERRMSLAEVAAMLPRAEEPPPPEAKVLRAMFATRGATALKPVLAASESDPVADRDARQRRVLEALRAHHGPTPFRVVTDDD
jgi:transposase InsO family protein